MAEKTKTTPQENTPQETTSDTAPQSVPLMSWSDLLARTRPETDIQIRTGDAETDIIDLWLPEGGGPHPVVIMVHGGCWQKSIADRTLMNYAAEDLRQKGLAVWNIEYRGVDEPGGGYPGTFLDVAKAADALLDYAPEYNLRTDRIAGFGHSAGGHLVTWLSARASLPESSLLFSDNPLPLTAVINSGGLADLAASAPVTQASCLADIMDTLTGSPSDTRPNVLSDTSTPELFPVTARQISINGDSDRIAPGKLGQSYTQRALESGTPAEYFEIKHTGHVELIAPGTDAFERTVQVLEESFEGDAE